MAETTTIRYSSNNSGGGWWLSDQNWLDLEKAGWKVRWIKDDPYHQKFATSDRFLGALATEALRTGLSQDEAIAEFEKITGLDTNDPGCECCGQPHSFGGASGDF